MNETPADDVERPARLGQLMGSALGSGPGRATLAAQRVAFIDAVARFDEKPALFRSRAVRLLVPTLAAVVALIFFVTRPPAALSARYLERPLGQHEIAQGAQGGDDAVSFSDGSRVRLDPTARIELTEMSPLRAALRLHQGSLRASIQKHTGRTWSVHAGPYEVRVVGTEFSVEWRDDALSVEVTQGKVLVFGGDLPAAGHALTGGQRLERRVAAERSVAPAEPIAGAANAPAAQNHPQPMQSAVAAGSKDTWLALAEKAKYKEALAQARQEDFGKLLETLADKDLLLLANVARYAGDAPRAKVALRKVRERFGGTRASALAALYLARVAETQDHDLPEAQRWLRQFLVQEPTGDLASGARASLIDIALHSGDRAQARAAAAEYLKYHPNGPHANQARSLLASQP